MVRNSPSIEQRKQYYNRKANNVGVVHNEQTDYITYINSIYGMLYSFYQATFYSDIITQSRLQLINTSIDTFLRKLYAFLKEKKEGH